MPRPILVTIDIQALQQNLRRVRQKAADRDLWAVVKANAYGHGIANAVEAFSQTDGLATLEMRDAVFIRSLGWKKRILLLEGFFDEADLLELERYDVETVVHSEWMIDLIKQHGPYQNLKVHIKVNSGMNRLGFAPEDFQAVRNKLSAIVGCKVQGLVTHFANAEKFVAADKVATVRAQLDALGELSQLKGACLANSGATIFHDEVVGDALRAGVVLYGVSPDSAVTSVELGLIPAMTLSAQIIAVQHVKAGRAVGYGSRWVAKRDSRIAVVACGYADGYPRSMPDGAPVWVENAVAPLAGSVSMDMMTIDVTDLPQAKIGSWVELWGRHIDVNVLAKLCGTIGYELLTALAPRVPVVKN